MTDRSSTLSLPTPMTKRRSAGARLAGASMIGTTLEWYDFTIYNTLAALIFNHLFFPSFDPVAGSILAFSTYAVGFLSRPVGGIVFGRLGDQIGRRAILVVTLAMMGVTTTLMGLLPTYDSIGIFSPLALVALRFVQGVAIGGEWAGSVLLAMEHGRQDRRGLNGSWTQIGPSAGTLVATAIIAVLNASLSQQQFAAWGWRLPCVASAVLVVMGLWARRGLDESPAFRALESRHQTVKAPVGEVLKHHWSRLLVASGSRVGVDVVYALAVVFSLTYITTILHLPSRLALTAVLIGAAANGVCIPTFGLLSDWIGRRTVYGFGVALGVIWAFLFFAMVDTRQPGLVIAAVILGFVIHAVMYGPQAAFIAEQFATPVRYTGASLAYTCAGILGGLAPLLILSLFQHYGTNVAISLYVLAALAITTAALSIARETAGKPLAS